MSNEKTSREAVNRARGHLSSREDGTNLQNTLSNIDISTLRVSTAATRQYLMRHGGESANPVEGIKQTLALLMLNGHMDEEPETQYLYVYGDGYRITLNPEHTAVVGYNTNQYAPTLSQVRGQTPPDIQDKVTPGLGKTLSKEELLNVDEDSVDNLQIPGSVLTHVARIRKENFETLRNDIRDHVDMAIENGTVELSERGTGAWVFENENWRIVTTADFRAVISVRAPRKNHKK